MSKNNMIQKLGEFFVLNTAKTTYAMRVLMTGQVEHLYYGARLEVESEEDLRSLCEQFSIAPGNTIVYDQEHWDYSLENIRLEMSAYGKGDIREPYVCLEYADGSSTADFVYSDLEILDDKPEFKTLPAAYDESGEAGALKITLKDKNSDLLMEIYYSVFYDSNVITRMTRLINPGEESVKIRRLMSNQLDLEGAGYVFNTFTGAWVREMNRVDTTVRSGKMVNSSYTGTSSNRANPFVMISRPKTSEDYGECYGFNLIYSGNHYEALEVNGFNKTRFVQGINPESFEFELLPKAEFEAPEAVMTYSNEGFNSLSQNMHAFVRENIVRGTWKKKERPVLLNSWEACYFDINESRLVSLAKSAKNVGIELLVMDDGWFGERNDDTKSLGDWTVNAKKLPGGVERLAQKVNEVGLSFGIWVEPEMVNEKSKLYEAHPEWVLKNPKTHHSMGRNQMVLDLGNTAVQDYIIESMTNVFSSGNIAYVKWDMNRIFTDYFSENLDKDHQGEVSHRYVMGLYRVMKELTEKFPDILFEGCASGGNRFDLGILSYFPQIWASDDTDAMARVAIETGYSYGYPLSCVTAHVSDCPNHQTLRTTPIETRFNVAAVGVLGYECNLNDMSREDIEAIKKQVALYKEKRRTLQFGTFYRGRSVFDEDTDKNITEWTVVSEDKKEAIAVQVQKLSTPNMPNQKLCVRGLDPDEKYLMMNRELKVNIKDFGSLVNAISPVHVKPGSLLHEAMAKIVKLDGEKEYYLSTGKIFTEGGIYLKQNFGGVGFNENIRHFQDFGSRMYIFNVFN